MSLSNVGLCIILAEKQKKKKKKKGGERGKVGGSLGWGAGGVFL